MPVQSNLRLCCFISSIIVLISCQSKPAAKTSLRADKHYNFGTIYKSDTLDHAFMILNDGDKPLHIKAANPGCGCTVADFSKNEILPGDSGYLKFRLVPKDTGNIQNSIVIETNADTIFHVFYIKGRVAGQRL